MAIDFVNLRLRSPRTLKVLETLSFYQNRSPYPFQLNAYTRGRCLHETSSPGCDITDESAFLVAFLCVFVVIRPRPWKQRCYPHGEKGKIFSPDALADLFSSEERYISDLFFTFYFSLLTLRNGPGLCCENRLFCDVLLIRRDCECPLIQSAEWACFFSFNLSLKWL